MCDETNMQIPLWQRIKERGVCAATSDDMAIESVAVILFCAFGYWMAFAEMFNTCPQVYWVMQSALTDRAWGAIFILVGMAQLIGLLIDNLTLRRSTLLVQGALWATLCCALVIGDWRAPGTPVFAVFSMAAFRGFLCLKKCP